MARTNKSIYRSILKGINEGNHAVLDEFLAPDVIIHGFSSPHPGREAFKQLGKMFAAAFPDFRQTIEMQFSAGDKVVTVFKNEGTHRGEFMGLPATGKKVSWIGLQIDRFQDGKIVEMWSKFDTLELYHKLSGK